MDEFVRVIAYRELTESTSTLEKTFNKCQISMNEFKFVLII